MAVKIWLYNVSARLTVKKDKFTLFVYCNFLVLSKYILMHGQNINKQIVNISDENLMDYSFLKRYHYTKSKNYLRRRYWSRHWIPMFIGTPCIIRKAKCVQGRFHPWVPQSSLIVSWRKTTLVRKGRRTSPAQLPNLILPKEILNRRRGR